MHSRLTDLDHSVQFPFDNAIKSLLQLATDENVNVANMYCIARGFVKKKIGIKLSQIKDWDKN